MSGLVDYEYDFFDQYQSAVLANRPSIEQLIRLDDEVANKIVIPRYEGPVDPVEWTALESYYSELFADFITDRIQGLVDTDPIEENRSRFHDFRTNITALNQKLPAQRSVRTEYLSKPAETVLLKELRQLGFDPSSLEVTHIGRGGGLYLLELFVTAAQQEAVADTELLSALLLEAEAIGSMSKSAAITRLNRPVLMVSLWENQLAGLEAWLENGRHGILEMATATGKTVAGIAAIAECCGVLPDDEEHEPRTSDANIMIVAHSNAILKQWEQEICEKLGLLTPMGQNGKRADQISFSGGKVEFYTAQSLLPRYDRDLAAQYDLVIYDEVHHYSNEDGYGAAIDRPDYQAAMGLSATIGDDGELKREHLTDLLGDVVYTYGVEDAQRDGIIPEFDWTVHPTPLDPYERDEWEEATESISDQFKHIRGASETQRILKQLPVPFTELEDLGDFIRAHEAASMAMDDDRIPDEWANLQATIHSRTWIRHRSQPKIKDAIDLAKEYLADPDRPIKVVIFAMDIDTTNEIADQLSDVSDNVYRAHSQLETSSKKNNARVQQNIDSFAKCDNGVLVSPKMLDEGIDVPDAEVGINVAGTKTKLQLVQRMGRVLRKHGDQRPHFHHFIAVPDDNYIAGIDSKEYVQELNWVRELGETIGVQPIIDEAGVDTELLSRAEQRGNELWARDLLDDLEVETVQGNVHLDQLLEDLTLDALEILLDELWLEGEEVAKDDWKSAMDTLRESDTLAVESLQRVWWLFPLYHEQPTELKELLAGSYEALSEGMESPGVPSEGPSQSNGTSTSDESDDEGNTTEPTDPEKDATPSSTEEDEADEETAPTDDPDDPESPALEPTETGEVDLEETEKILLDKEATSIFDILGVERPSGVISGEQQVTPDVQASVDEDLLTGVGQGGLISSGYLHGRSLQTYLLQEEHPVFLLSSKRRSPECSDQPLPSVDNHRAITAITPRRVLCVVGNDPENAVVQVRHESITGVEIDHKGKFLWKRPTLHIETDDRTLTIPDGTHANLDEVAQYLRTAAYKRRCTAGKRRLECCDVVAATHGVSAIKPVLTAAKEDFESAVRWGQSHGLDTEHAETGVSFTKSCLGRTKKRASVATTLEKAQRLVRESRTASINEDMNRAREQAREAKAEIDSLPPELREHSDSRITEIEQLRAKIDEVLSSASDTETSENSSTDSEGPVEAEQITTEESGSPSRAELISELQSLADSLNGVPKAPEMDERGAYSTHEYYQEFGSWEVALQEAGLDRRRALLSELERLATELGEIPSTTQIDKHGRYSAGMYSAEFGSITEAREAADFSAIEESAEADTQLDTSDQAANDTKSKNSTQDSTPSRDALVQEIQRLDDGESPIPRASKMDSEGAYKTYDCIQEFGSWDEALAAADIDKGARLLEDLRRVRDELGHVPTLTEMKDRGRVSTSMCANFFGSWSNATAQIEPTEQQTTDENTSSNTETGDESSASSTLTGEDVLTWEDIPDNRRLPDPIAVRITKRKRATSDRVGGRYQVADLNGKEFDLKIWQKHDLTINWRVGTWYVLSEARGTVWESKGETRRMLDSTQDLVAVDCGTERPTRADFP